MLILSLYRVTKKPRKEYYINKPALSLIGAKMRDIRVKKGFSIEYLANVSGMDYSQLARMETGQVNFTISYLFRVAEALGVTPKELLP
jgi:transcriptional regulator with XRE-family HTH domain